MKSTHTLAGHLRLIVKAAVAGFIAINPLLASAQETAPPPPVAAPSPVAPTYSPAAPAHPLPSGHGLVEPDHGHHTLFGGERYRSPGLAVALSLQPLPIDFGNLYAENLGWGIAYTAIEVSLMAPMMWVAGQHMGHGSSDDRSWSDTEQGAMVGLVAGYVAVKLVAGLHAGYAARAYNRSFEPRQIAFVAPSPGGALFAWASDF